MRKSLAMLAAVAAFGSAGVAEADDGCFVPMANWQPRDAVLRMAGARGWIVRRIKIDDGCYEIAGSDEQGRAIEATVDPGTLAVIDVEYEGSGDGRDRRGHDSD